MQPSNIKQPGTSLVSPSTDSLTPTSLDDPFSTTNNESEIPNIAPQSIDSSSSTPVKSPVLEEEAPVSMATSKTCTLSLFALIFLSPCFAISSWAWDNVSFRWDLAVISTPHRLVEKRIQILQDHKFWSMLVVQLVVFHWQYCAKSRAASLNDKSTMIYHYCCNLLQGRSEEMGQGDVLLAYPTISSRVHSLEQSTSPG